MSKNDNLGAGEIVGIAIGSAIVIGLIVGSQYNSNNSNDIAEFVGTIGGMNPPSVEQMTTLYNEGKGKIKDVNVIYNDVTALMVQSASGSPEAITWLLDNGADINFQNSEGYTALYFAIISKNNDNIKLLLSKRAKAIIKLTDGSQLNLNELIRGNERKIMQEKNTETEKDSISQFVGTIGVNIPTLDKMTTLYNEGKIKDVNVTYNGLTALMVQSASGTREPIEWLQSKGADPNIKNKEGETAVDLAIKFGNTQAQQLLEDININKDFVGQLTSQDTPKLDKMKELFTEDKINNVNVTYNGITALMVQSRYGTIETMKWLLENGADTNIKNSNGRTALWYAVAANVEAKVKLLLDHEANPQFLDNKGMSILFYAVKTKKETGIIKIFKSLLPDEVKKLSPEEQAELEKVEKEEEQQAIEKEKEKEAVIINSTDSSSSTLGGKRLGNKKFTVSRFGYTRRKRTNNNKSKKIKPNKIKSKKNKI
uniref:Uncharacterized protein n=1 Tax=viral metagenome TaxID=1070528 RepID=A0A6C0I6K1_9ZZZZ